jgi:hypothetical protein
MNSIRAWKKWIESISFHVQYNNRDEGLKNRFKIA